jgi:hypothetical protein
MKRAVPITALLLAAIAAIGGAAAWWLGDKAEHGFQRLAEALAAEPGIEVLDRSYERGWLKGAGAMRLASGEPRVETSLRLDAEHGPFPPSRLASGRFVPVALVFHLRSGAGSGPGEPPSMDLYGVVDLAGTIRGEFTAARVALHIDPQRRLVLGDARGDLRVQRSDGGKELELRAEAGGFQVEEEGAVTEFGRARVSAQGRSRGRLLAGLTLRTWRLDADTLRFVPRGEGRPIELTGVGIDAGWSAATGLADGRLRASCDSLSAGGREFGAGTLAIDAERIDMDALERMNRRIASARTSGAPPPRAEVLNALAAVVAGGTKVTLREFSLETGNGPIVARATLEVDAGHPDLGVDTVALVEATRIRIHAALPEAALRDVLSGYTRRQLAASQSRGQAGAPDPSRLDAVVEDAVDAQIGEFLERGYLRREGQGFELDAGMDAGRLTINGQPVAPVPAPG